MEDSDGFNHEFDLSNGQRVKLEFYHPTMGHGQMLYRIYIEGKLKERDISVTSFGGWNEHTEEKRVRERYDK